MIDPCGCQGGKSVQPMPKQDENDNVIFRDDVPDEPWVDEKKEKEDDCSD